MKAFSLLFGNRAFYGMVVTLASVNSFNVSFQLVKWNRFQLLPKNIKLKTSRECWKIKIRKIFKEKENFAWVSFVHMYIENLRRIPFLTVFDFTE